MNQHGISPEARAFIQSFVRDDAPTDFSQMDQIRKNARDLSVPIAERAIMRHRLLREDVVINGVDCERIISQNGGHDQGTLLYLFGGAFMVGCPYSDLSIIGALADWCQVEVIAPKYRLAPEFPAPAAAEDCFAVWQQLVLDSDGPFLLAGESAGGNLSLVLVQEALAKGVRIPDAIALLSPGADLRIDSQIFEPTLNADPTLSIESVTEVLAAYGSNRDPMDPLLSPLFGPMEGMPPTIITTGTRDMFLSTCLRLERKMRRAGVDADCRVWDGLWHVFEYYDGFPEAEESLLEIAAFLNAKIPAA